VGEGGNFCMEHQFADELRCLEEIEDMIENSNLLQHNEIKENFSLLLDLKEELVEDTGENDAITESILEDISLITKELTVMVEDRYGNTKLSKKKSSLRYN
jgi:hypothetical protein